MDKVATMFSENPTMCKVVGGLLAATAGVVLFKWLRRRRAVKNRKEYPRDTVILHQIGRGPYAPSLTPFGVKLETYLRMTKIPYQNEHARRPSNKGKFPWITYNGEEIADSTFCIHYLNKRLNVDLSDFLTPEQRAVEVALQRLVEDDLYWVMVVTRWLKEVDEDFVRKALWHISFPMLMLRLFFKPAIRKMTHAQGVGRHSMDEIRHIARKDFTALSDYLGTKKYMMGDRPCEVDCAIFGQLSQVYWQMPCSISRIFKEEYPGLVSYCERMKETFWPDWDDCTTRGATSKATR